MIRKVGSGLRGWQRLGSMWAIVAMALLGALPGGCSAPRVTDTAGTESPIALTPNLSPVTPVSPTAVVATATASPQSATQEPARTPTPTPTLPATARPATPSTPETVRAKIEMVWPHGGASVREAELANITAYLIAEKGNDPPPCDWEPTVRLWAALNSQPARPIAVGEKRMVTASGRTFPAWDFNDVDVSAARDPANKITFFATVDGVRTLRNIWVHAADARTLLPQPDVPLGVVDAPPAAVDARIEVVWPHDDLPVEQARLANVTAYLFATNSLEAIPPGLGWRPAVRLHYSLNTDAEELGAYLSAPIGSSRVITTEAGLAFLAWDFDNIDVSAAQDPINKLYFWLSVDDVIVFPNVWAHGSNTPTISPQTDVLNSCK